MINIVLADDHSIVSSGLRKILEQLTWANILKECTRGAQVIAFAAEHKNIDVVITDYRMPEMTGLELTMHLKRINPDIKIIILSMHDDLKHVSESLHAQASGYLLKNADIEELSFAIKRVAQGHTYVGNELVANFLKGQSFRTAADLAPLSPEQFSSRELEILNLIAGGLTNMDISNKLFLSKRTVEGHRQSLLQKTNSANTASLIRYAVKSRLIE